MPRSEYYEPALLPGEKEQPQIIIDAVELYDLLVRAEMMMTKVDRIRYGNRAVAQIQDVIKEFMLAYDFEEDRRIHYTRFVDDMVWVVENKEAGLSHVAMSERMLLDEYGYRMHPRKRYQHITARD